VSIHDEAKIDCHTHLFDPVRFPYRADTPYAPAGQEVATFEQFNRVLDAHGVQHALLVGPTSGYRTDNRCLLDALARGAGRLRGIAVVEHTTDLNTLMALRDQGVVGVAFNPALEGVAVLNDAEGLFERLAEAGLFAQVQASGAQWAELLPWLERTSAALLIDHCGRPDLQAGLEQPGFQALLSLARGERPVAVKLSGMQKFASIDHLEEQAGPYIHALLAAFGAQACVWGSDWPFIRERSRVDYGPLLSLAERLLPASDVRHQVLWETPRRLFGFQAKDRSSDGWQL
jgi:predicted TIM-barrel fold metal-dependent hydrolase